MIAGSITCLAGAAAVAIAQSASPSYTQMILGSGFSPSDPVFTLGFEHKPSNSNVSWRLMTEYYERGVSDPISSSVPSHAFR